MKSKTIKAMKCREITDGYSSEETLGVEESTLFLFDGEINKEIAEKALSAMSDFALGSSNLGDDEDDEDVRKFREAVEELAETEEVSYNGYEFYLDNVVLLIPED